MLFVPFVRRCTLGVALTLATAQRSGAQPAPPRQTEADAYTRYELQAPGSAKFRIVYDVTATTAGATHYFNPIRAGSIATDEYVSDRATGKSLVFDVVGAAVARAGGVRVSDTTQQYIRVTLARPVPANGGEARVLIDKTYEDAKSYFTDGTTLVFNRPLGIKRNAVVLPKGYELESCNYPSQIRQEADGRIAISFWNNTPAEAPLVLRARPVPTLVNAARPVQSSVQARLAERAIQSREIVYFLQQPETHAFDLYHDYTESRPGTAYYINVVRAGSRVSNPSARNLDTGEALRLDVLKGDAIAAAKLDIGEPVTPRSWCSGLRRWRQARPRDSACPRRIPTARGTDWSARSWCGIAASAGRPTRSCSRRGGYSRTARSRLRCPPCPTDASVSTSSTRAPMISRC